MKLLYNLDIALIILIKSRYSFLSDMKIFHKLNQAFFKKEVEDLKRK